MPRWLERSESQRLEALASNTRHIAAEQTTRFTGGHDLFNSSKSETLLTDLETGFEIRALPEEAKEHTAWAILSGDNRNLAYEYNEKEIYVSPIYSREELNKLAEKLKGGRTLTPEEKISFGLGGEDHE